MWVLLDHIKVFELIEKIYYIISFTLELIFEKNIFFIFLSYYKLLFEGLKIYTLFTRLTKNHHKYELKSNK